MSASIRNETEGRSFPQPYCWWLDFLSGIQIVVIGCDIFAFRYIDTNNNYVVTARKQSYGKVMFLQASVCSRWGGGGLGNIKCVIR